MIHNTELIVRKKVSNFLENLLNFCGYQFRHDIYKEIVYSERESRIQVDEMIKNYYDAMNYLFNNHKTPFTHELLKKFFYVIDCQELELNLGHRLISKFFFLDSLPTIEKAIEFHLYAYQEMQDFEENKRFILSLIFLNFVLVKNNISCIQINKNDFLHYVEYKALFYSGKKEKMLFLILELVKQTKPQDKSYYLQLRKLDFNEIFHTIFKDKEQLKKEYSIKGLYIFGSFARNKERIDSDIDFLVQFCQDMTYEEKKEQVERLSNYYFNIFKRNIDVAELEQYLTDDFIKVMSNIKKII